MPLPPLDLTLPTDTLRVVAWPDPVIDRLGHDPRSAYAETFWLPIIGPSTYLLLRQLAAHLEAEPDGFDLPLLDTAASLGLGTRGGRNSPFLRAIARSITFKLSRHEGRDTLAVRRRLAPLTRPQVARLDPVLRDRHDAWSRESQARPTPDQQRRRARRLALSLAELGEPDEAIEHQLHQWHLHPALAHDALRWARQHQPGGTGPDEPPEAVSVADRHVAADPARAVPPRPPRPRVGQSFDPAGDAA